ncbi:hypothetical protein L6164_029466 [Bauhinia variegata]|uniref:Uncharacterized protein n=1 Tax=Bauhinia variegata TaxID=167791 RepID=A0ACB9L9F9_BAUVA|nr:hypothetical protein L6164_029466 [Bauhinia variegata]
MKRGAELINIHFQFFITSVASMTNDGRSTNTMIKCSEKNFYLKRKCFEKNGVFKDCVCPLKQGDKTSWGRNQIDKTHQRRSLCKYLIIPSSSISTSKFYLISPFLAASSSSTVEIKETNNQSTTTTNTKEKKGKETIALNLYLMNNRKLVICRQ